MEPYLYGRSLLCPGKYREAFLYWPVLEAAVKDVPEGWVGYEYTLMMTCTAGCGQKDWVGIFKEPKIPMGLKHDLLSMIHEYGPEGDFDEYLITSLGRKEESDLHSAILSYIAYMKQANYMIGEKDVKYDKLLYLFSTNIAEEILPYIFMDSRIPLSIKVHLMLLLHINGNKDSP